MADRVNADRSQDSLPSAIFELKRRDPGAKSYLHLMERRVINRRNTRSYVPPISLLWSAQSLMKSYSSLWTGNSVILLQENPRLHIMVASGTTKTRLSEVRTTTVTRNEVCSPRAIGEKRRLLGLWLSFERALSLPKSLVLMPPSPITSTNHGSDCSYISHFGELDHVIIHIRTAICRCPRWAAMMECTI